MSWLTKCAGVCNVYGTHFCNSRTCPASGDAGSALLSLGETLFIERAEIERSAVCHIQG